MKFKKIIKGRGTWGVGRDVAPKDRGDGRRHEHTPACCLVRVVKRDDVDVETDNLILTVRYVPCTSYHTGEIYSCIS